MKKILKYSIDSEDSTILQVGRNEPFTIEMIKGAKILTVQTQPCPDRFGMVQNVGRIWVLVNHSETEKEKRTFVLIETGQTIDEESHKYIGTYQVFGGRIVLHLFEIIKVIRVGL